MAFHDLYYANGVQSRNPTTRSFERDWRDKMSQLQRRVATVRTSIPKPATPSDIPHLRHQPIGGHLFTRSRLHEVNRQNRQLMGKMHEIFVADKKFKVHETKKIPKYTAKKEIDKHRRRLIERENTSMLERVKSVRSAIHNVDYLKDYRDRCEIMARISTHPDHFFDTMTSIDDELSYMKRLSGSMNRLSSMDDKMSTTSSNFSSRDSRKSSQQTKRRRRRHSSRSDSQLGRVTRTGSARSSTKQLPPINKRSETWIGNE